MAALPSLGFVLTLGIGPNFILNVGTVVDKDGSAIDSVVR